MQALRRPGPHLMPEYHPPTELGTSSATPDPRYHRSFAAEAMPLLGVHLAPERRLRLTSTPSSSRLLRVPASLACLLSPWISVPILRVPPRPDRSTTTTFLSTAVPARPDASRALSLGISLQSGGDGPSCVRFVLSCRAGAWPGAGSRGVQVAADSSSPVTAPSILQPGSLQRRRERPLPRGRLIEATCACRLGIATRLSRSLLSGAAGSVGGREGNGAGRGPSQYLPALHPSAETTLPSCTPHCTSWYTTTTRISVCLLFFF